MELTYEAEPNFLVHQYSSCRICNLAGIFLRNGEMSEWPMEIIKSVFGGLAEQAFGQYKATRFAKEHANGEFVLFSSPGGHQIDGEWPARTGEVLITDRRVYFSSKGSLIRGKRVFEHQWAGIKAEVSEGNLVMAPSIKIRDQQNKQHKIWITSITENKIFVKIVSAIIDRT